MTVIDDDAVVLETWVTDGLRLLKNLTIRVCKR